MYNVHSVVVGVSNSTERLVAEIPLELKQLVDADQRTNKEVVEAALWREFGGERLGSLERRIEEKKRKISLIESEKNERQREMKQERQELEALQQKREAVEEQQQTQEEKRAETWDRAMDNLNFKETNSLGTVISSSKEAVEQWADRLDMDTREFKQEAIDRYDG